MKEIEHCILLLERAKAGKLTLRNNDFDTIIKALKTAKEVEIARTFTVSVPDSWLEETEE